MPCVGMGWAAAKSYQGAGLPTQQDAGSNDRLSGKLGSQNMQKLALGRCPNFRALILEFYAEGAANSACSRKGEPRQ